MVFQQPPYSPPGRKVSSSQEPSERTRVTFTLAQEDFDRLSEIADSAEASISEVLQRSVATALFLQQQIDSGHTILLRAPDGSLSEVKLR
jgi:hypothetical protein